MYGIDLVGDRLSVAGSVNEAGRTTVNCLDCVDIDNISPDLLLGPVGFTIPEESAIIKRIKIRLDERFDSNRLAEFEFATSLLDDADQFRFESHSLNGGRNFLVFGYRRQLIDEKKKYLADFQMQPERYKLRSWAMAEGYLNYCWREGGELICLLDISEIGVSYSFIKNSRPIQVGFMPGKIDPKNPHEARKSLLLDLKATIKYNLDILFADGYSAPLSLIISSGRMADFDLNLEIEKLLRVRTITPTIKTALFNPEIVDLAGRFLPSLGLIAGN